MAEALRSLACSAVARFAPPGDDEPGSSYQKSHDESANLLPPERFLVTDTYLIGQGSDRRKDETDRNQCKPKGSTRHGVTSQLQRYASR